MFTVAGRGDGRDSRHGPSHLPPRL